MSQDSSEAIVTAFSGTRRICTGPRTAVLSKLRNHAQAQMLLIFEDHTGERVELDLGVPSQRELPLHDEAPPSRGVGRPKLGVVAREVTLLPRHWDWLSRQPGGASVAIRRLIDEARHHYAQRDAVRAGQERAYRVMSALAASLPRYEEAARALFAADQARFERELRDWPSDVAEYLKALAEPAWASSAARTI